MSDASTKARQEVAIKAFDAENSSTLKNDKKLDLENFMKLIISNTVLDALRRVVRKENEMCLTSTLVTKVIQDVQLFEDYIANFYDNEKLVDASLNNKLIFNETEPVR